MSMEERILNGIIKNKVKYFIDNYKSNKQVDIFINYLNDYIAGNLSETRLVYDDIIQNFNYELVNILDELLNPESYKEFIAYLQDYLITDSITEDKKFVILDCFYSKKKCLNVVENLENILDFIIDSKNIVVTLKIQSLPFKIILKLLKNKITRAKVIKYFYEKEKKISRFNCDYTELTETIIEEREKSDNFNINLIYIKIQLWLNGINNQKLIEISREKENFLSKIYFLINKSLETTVISFFEEKKEKIKELSKLNILLKDDLSLSEKSIILNYTLLLKRRLKTLYSIIENKLIIDIVDKFYTNVIYWLNKVEFKECVDELLTCLHIFYNNIEFDLDNQKTSLITSILGGKFTKNPNLKISYLYLFHTYIVKIIKYNSKVLAIPNHVDYDSNVNQVIKSFIKFFHDIKDSFQSEEVYSILNPVYIMSGIINVTISQDNYRDSYYKVIEDKECFKYFKELIYCNLNNFQYISDEIFKCLKQLNLEENGNKNVQIIKNLKEDIDDLNSYYCVFSIFIKNICKYFSELILSDEIKNCFINIIIILLNITTTNKLKQFKIKDKDSVTFKPIDLLNDIHKFIINIIIKKENEKQLSYLFGTNDNYTESSILKMINILDKYDDIKRTNYSSLSYFDYLISEHLNKIKDLEEKEIPDELCDPLMDTLIEEPVMLPNKVIVDYQVIKRHLLNDSTNPFNRELLTIEILEEYNKRKEVKEEIDLFKKKIKDFKESV